MQLTVHNYNLQMYNLVIKYAHFLILFSNLIPRYLIFLVVNSAYEHKIRNM